MINSYSEFGFYNPAPQHGDHQVAYRFGNLALNAAANGYPNRSNLVHPDSGHSYVESKLFDQPNHTSYGDCVVKSENGFKSPDQPPSASSTGSWNTSAVRPTPSPATSLTAIQTGDSMRFDPVAYPRSLPVSDMHPSCCQSFNASNAISYHQSEAGKFVQLASVWLCRAPWHVEIRT